MLHYAFSIATRAYSLYCDRQGPIFTAIVSSHRQAFIPSRHFGPFPASFWLSQLLRTPPIYLLGTSLSTTRAR